MFQLKVGYVAIITPPIPLVYELSVLKAYAEPLLLQVEPGKPGYVEAHRLFAFLQWFEPAPVDPVPRQLDPARVDER